MHPDELEARLTFLFPPEMRHGLLDVDGDGDGIDLAYLHPRDEGERSFLVLAEHPEFLAAIRDEVDDVVVGGHVVNPRLHLTLHEVVANQVIGDDPPETWQTAERLTALGYDRAEVLHMLASVNASMIWRASRNGDVSRAALLAELDELPASWEADRPVGPSGVASSPATPRTTAPRRATPQHVVPRAHRPRRRH